MTFNRSTNDIKKYTGQVFTTEKFSVEKIRQRVRLLTGLPNLIINQFLYTTIEDFCQRTWILRKLIQVGEILTEVDNESDYYVVSIDLEDYADGLLVHDINEISINGRTHLATRDAYLGDPTGSNEISTGGDTYISADTYIAPTTYIGGESVNEGVLVDGPHYEIVDDTTIKVWPLQLEDVVLIPVIFKTSDVATEIPFILEDYFQEIASGVITMIRKMPRHAAKDEAFHKSYYESGISKAKFQYAKQYKGNQIENTYFAI